MVAHIQTICDDVSAVQAHSCQSMAQCFLGTQCDGNSRMDSLARIIGIEQQSIAVIRIGDGLECLFLGREEFDQGMRDSACRGKAELIGGIEQ